MTIAIVVNGAPISWATLAASCPSVTIFSDSITCRSNCRRCDRSRTIVELARLFDEPFFASVLVRLTST